MVKCLQWNGCNLAILPRYSKIVFILFVHFCRVSPQNSARAKCRGNEFNLFQLQFRRIYKIPHNSRIANASWYYNKREQRTTYSGRRLCTVSRVLCVYLSHQYVFVISLPLLMQNFPFYVIQTLIFKIIVHYNVVSTQLSIKCTTAQQIEEKYVIKRQYPRIC